MKLNKPYIFWYGTYGGGYSFTIKKFIHETQKWHVKIMKQSGNDKNLVFENNPTEGFKMLEYIKSEITKEIEKLIEQKKRLDEEAESDRNFPYPTPRPYVITEDSPLRWVTSNSSTLETMSSTDGHFDYEVDNG